MHHIRIEVLRIELHIRLSLYDRCSQANVDCWIAVREQVFRNKGFTSWINDFQLKYPFRKFQIKLSLIICSHRNLFPKVELDLSCRLLSESRQQFLFHTSRAFLPFWFLLGLVSKILIARYRCKTVPSSTLSRGVNSVSSFDLQVLCSKWMIIRLQICL